MLDEISVLGALAGGGGARRELSIPYHSSCS